MPLTCPLTALGFGPPIPCAALLPLADYAPILERETKDHKAAVRCPRCKEWVGLEIENNGKKITLTPTWKPRGIYTLPI
jgi:hypothetical protein